MILNEHDKSLLIALRKGNHFKANPGDVFALLESRLGDAGPSEGLSSARRLKEHGLARFVTDNVPSDRTYMRITDQGIALADNLIQDRRQPTWRERIRKLPIGKALWDIFKIALGFALGLLASNISKG